jgi:hypothetical protein
MDRLILDAESNVLSAEMEILLTAPISKLQFPKSTNLWVLETTQLAKTQEFMPVG